MVGCVLCNAFARTPTLWAELKVTEPKQISPDGFLHHEQSRSHLEALGAVPPADDDAPSQQEFMDCIDATRKGQTCLPGCGRQQFRKEAFCVGEAKRIRNRRAWKDAVGASLHQDARKNNLVVRFQVGTSDMRRVFGVLGRGDLGQLAPSTAGMLASGIARLMSL